MLNIDILAIRLVFSAQLILSPSNADPGHLTRAGGLVGDHTSLSSLFLSTNRKGQMYSLLLNGNLVKGTRGGSG